jgi:tripartite-type tricarboxylate transporter receptor subunit TctC
MKQATFNALVTLIGLLAVLGVTSAHAQEKYPSRAIELVIPWGPGGVSDLIGRILAAELSKTLEVPVTPLNKPGASGTIGGAYVAAARKDGHTVMVGSLGWLVGSLLLDARYDPLTDFVPVMRISATPQSLFVKSDSPVKSLEDLVDRARRDPNRISIGTGGVASDSNFALQIFQRASGIQLHVVPFKTGADTPTAVLGGHVDVGIGVLSAPINLVRAGSLRVLAISGPERIAELPEVPTFSERGFTQTYLDNWNGLVVPAGVPQQVVDTLTVAAAKAMKSRDVIAGIQKNSSVVDAESGAQFRARLQNERKIIESMAAELNLKGNK